MPKIAIPTALRQYTGGQESVEVRGGTIDEALASLTGQYPDLKKHLFDGQGKLRNFVNVYVNDEDIRYQQQENTPIKESDEISIIPSIAGGVITEDELKSAALPELTKDEVARYSRHLIMPEVGMEGQRKLKAASVLLIGAGGLGSPLGLYLAAAGVGRLGLVDFDVVDHSNLQRQIIHGTKDVGRPKLQSAKDRLSDINPHIQIDTYEIALKAENALDIFKDYDIIIDGTDNFQTRYLANDASVLFFPKTPRCGSASRRWLARLFAGMASRRFGRRSLRRPNSLPAASAKRPTSSTKRCIPSPTAAANH